MFFAVSGKELMLTLIIFFRNIYRKQLLLRGVEVILFRSGMRYEKKMDHYF